MPIRILLISQSVVFYDEIGRALVDFGEIPHKLIKKTSFDSNIGEQDLIILNDPADLKQVIAYFEILFEKKLKDPTIIFISDMEVMQDAINANFCSPLTIKYLTKSKFDLKHLNSCIVHSINLTENRRTQRSNQNHYRSLFEVSMDPAFILDKEWNVTKVNEAFLNFLGQQKKDILNKPFANILINQSDLDILHQHFNIFPLNKATETVRIKHPGKRKGSLIHLKLVANSENSHPGQEATSSITGYNGTFIDITSQRQMETVKLQTDNLAMTYRLARSLAHEIRNPLTNVTLAIDQLKDEVVEGDLDNLELYFGIIDRSIKRIEVLIEQLLKGAERKTLSREETDIVALTKEVLLASIDRLKLRQIGLIRNFETEEFILSLDREKIKIAISNLITNAIEAIDEKVDGCITVGSCVEDDHVYIFIQDNGIGIDPSVIDKLFTPFYTGKKKGIGFGLTSAQSIVSEHGAVIDVESTKDKGTTFSIGFPLVKADQTDQSS